MASTSQVIREYLVSLGYSVDKGTERKFDTSLEKANVRTLSLAKGVLAVGVAAQAMVTLFARSMERMYYESRLAQSTVGNLQAVDFAARSIGLSGEGMVTTIKNVARALRNSPGLQGLAESLGVETGGGKRDMADVAKDLVTSLSKMEPYIGKQYADLFGIDSDTLLLWGENIEKYNAMLDKRASMNRDAGVDPDAAAKAAISLQDQFRDMMARIEVLKGALSIALLEPATRFYKLISDSLTAITRWGAQGGPAEATEQARTLGEKLKGGLKTGVQAYDYYREQFKSYLADMMRPGALSAYTKGKGIAPKEPGRVNPFEKPDIPNVFDWARDKFGRRPIPGATPISGGSAGALQYGGDELNRLMTLDAGTPGTQFSSPEVRARIFGSQYNGGQIASGSPTVTQTNTFHVSTSDPLAAASKVADQQRETTQNLGDLVRNNARGPR